MKHMKLKYYLRGLGIGIAVTSLVLGLSGRKESLTDEEIKARAAELGMVEDTVLSQLRETETFAEAGDTEAEALEAESVEVESETAATEEAMAEAAKTEMETIEMEATEMEATETAEEAKAMENEAMEPEAESETEAVEPEAEAQEQEAESKTETVEAESAEASKPKGKTVTITIRPGDTSWPIAKRVQEAGLVKDAAEFDDFLCDNGYSKYLRVGTHEIEAGASEEEIAKMLTRKN